MSSFETRTAADLGKPLNSDLDTLVQIAVQHPRIDAGLIVVAPECRMAVIPAEGLEYFELGPEPYLSCIQMNRITPTELADQMHSELELASLENGLNREVLFIARKRATARVYSPEAVQSLTPDIVASHAQRLPAESWAIKAKPLPLDVSSHFLTVVRGFPAESFDCVTYTGPDALPTMAEVESLTNSIRKLIFLGRDDPARADQQAANEYKATLIETGAVLRPLLDRALRSNPNTSRYLKFGEVAFQTTQLFLDRIPEIRKCVCDDIRHACDNDPAIRDRSAIELTHNGVDAVWRHRVAHELHKLSIPRIPLMMQRLTIRETGVDIHPAAEIEAPFFIDHGVGVVVGETCIIGPRCVLYAGVVLGSGRLPRGGTGEFRLDEKRHPTLEADVKVYSNASVLGNVVIGEGSSISTREDLWDSIPKNHIYKNGVARPLTKR